MLTSILSGSPPHHLFLQPLTFSIYPNNLMFNYVSILKYNKSMDKEGEPLKKSNEPRDLEEYRVRRIIKQEFSGVPPGEVRRILTSLLEKEISSLPQPLKDRMRFLFYSREPGRLRKQKSPENEHLEED